MDRDTDLAARVTARFACSSGHEFRVQFAADADLPTSWSCRQHGVEDCRRIDATANTRTAAKHKPARTHLVMLNERRSQADLETLLADMLLAIRRLRGARPGCVTIGGRSYSQRYDA